MIVSRERSCIFTLNAFLISFVDLLLIYISFLCLGAYNHMHSKSIDSYRLNCVPEFFVVVTEEEFNAYSSPKKIIKTRVYMKASPGEWIHAIEFLGEKGSYDIKVWDT